MNKKRDLQINTDFFDDNLKQLAIPQAILIGPSLSERIFMKSGLNEEDQNYQFPPSQNPLSFSVQIIQKIMSRKLVENFQCCWQKLKQQVSITHERNSSNFSHSKHRRLSPQVYNIHQPEQRVLQYLNEQSNLRIEGLPILKVSSLDDRTSRFEQLHQKVKIGKINSKNIILAKRTTIQTSNSHSQLQRANILKQIVQKLKQSRKEIHEVSDGVEQTRENYELNYRIGKLQRMYQNVHNKSQDNSQSQFAIANLKTTKDPQQEVTNQIKSQFANLRKEIEQLKRSNQNILKIQQRNKRQLHQLISAKQQQQLKWHELSLKQDFYKKQQLQRIEETKSQIRRSQLMLYNQIANFAQYKTHSHDQTNIHPQKKLPELQSKGNKIEVQRRQQIPKSLILMNHSQYYHEILAVIPQNNQFFTSNEQIQSKIKQPILTGNDGRFFVNQFGQKQIVQKQSMVAAVQPQKQDWNCSC